MPAATATPKSTAFVELGRRGAAKRWGADHDTTIVRLDTLPEPERRLIMTLIRNAKKAALADNAGAANDEEHGHAPADG